MASRASLNKVILIGNLTRDPELRYTPQGNAVCTFGLATNRSFMTSDGQKKEETEFHRLVSWNKLAELCSQLLSKGRKIYAEGRLQTRSYQTPDGVQKQITEIIIDDMRILDSRRFEGEEGATVGTTDKTPKVTETPKVEKKEVLGDKEEALKDQDQKKKEESQDSTNDDKAASPKKEDDTKKKKGAKTKEEDKKEEGGGEETDFSDLPF